MPNESNKTKMNTVELALKVNKYIHEQCIDGVPHDIGWNVVKLFLQPDYNAHSELLKSYFKWHKEQGFVSHKDSDIDEFILTKQT